MGQQYEKPEDSTDDSRVKQIAYDNYAKSSPWPENDLWHEITKCIIDQYVSDWICQFVESSDFTLVAGAGDSHYELDSKRTIYLDIVERYVKKYEHGLVAGIDDIPLENECVQNVICVGSVINYADAHRALDEFRRVLVPGGRLLLECERSDSAEFLLTPKHHRAAFKKEYSYNGQVHLLWLYGERYLNDILDALGFTTESRYRFQILSSLFNRFGVSESSAAKYARYDRALQPVSGPFAHNVIISAVKNPRTV